MTSREAFLWISSLSFQRLSVGTLPLSLAESVEESQHVEDWAEITDPVPGLLGVQPVAVG